MLHMRVGLLIGLALLTSCVLLYEEDLGEPSTIRKETQKTVEIVWADSEGQEHRIRTIQPGESANLDTEVECERGTQLIAKDLGGTVIDVRDDPLCPTDTWTIREPPDASGT
jgi:hypothetical protein